MIASTRLGDIGQPAVVVTTSWAVSGVALLLRRLKLVPSLGSGRRLKL